MIGNLNTIRSEGYNALTQKLGAAGAIQFLRQIQSGGHGNYTEERRTMLETATVDDIVKQIRTQKDI